MENTLMQASRQWASRPDDERFTSLLDMHEHFARQRAESRAVVAPSRSLRFLPGEDHKSLTVAGAKGVDYAPTHYAFGQVAGLGKAPAGYLRTLPAEVAAACLTVSLAQRDVEDVGLLLQSNGERHLRAATGPNYGRIWNVDITRAVTDFVRRHGGDGSGRNGDWRNPGEFGNAVEVTKGNTTFYASDRDMFVFLANEKNRITIPGRRAGKFGDFARGFFIWNSEVGKSTFGLATFLFDFTCCNRIVWGAEGFQEIRIRHTASAPDRWLNELEPALQTYGEAATEGVTTLIENARAAKLADVDTFLADHFGPRMVASLKAVHELEEFRPIETAWDVVTAVTAHARSIPYQDTRIELERQAGELLRKAA